MNVSGEVDIEDLIPEETCVFTLTDFGYIKRIPMSEYQTQRRGGKGIKGLTRREDDIVKTMFTASTHDHIAFFTSKGRTFRLKGYEIPEGSRTSKGMNIVNLLPLEGGETISSMNCGRGDDYKYLCMFTRNGIIKRSAVTEYANIRRTGVIAITLDEGDELAWVKMTKGNDDIIVPMLSLGGQGVISVAANILPKATHDVCAKYLEGDTGGSREDFLKLLKLIRSLFIEVNPIPIKTAMNLLGYQVGPLRMPLCDMTEEHLDTLKSVLSEYGLLKN